MSDGVVCACVCVCVSFQPKTTSPKYLDAEVSSSHIRLGRARRCHRMKHGLPVICTLLTFFSPAARMITWDRNHELGGFGDKGAWAAVAIIQSIICPGALACSVGFRRGVPSSTIPLFRSIPQFVCSSLSSGPTCLHSWWALPANFASVFNCASSSRSCGLADATATS